MGSWSSLRHGAALVVAFGVVVACSSADDPAIPPGDEAGVDGSTPPPGVTPPGVDGGADTAPPPPACGRNSAKKCADGEACDGSLDCVSGVCRSGTCQAAKPADGVKNGDETDVDCGGSSAPACPDGLHCAIKDDCESGVCTGAVCQVPTDSDGVKNGDETGVDCGGASTKKCAAGQGCKTTTDCDMLKCDVGATNLCLAPSHSDGFKNDGETGVDCGGAALPAKCAQGDGCATNADCNALKCDTGATNLCLPPSHTDGVKNLGETGVDCGGAALPALCAQGDGCASNADCNALKCDAGGTNLCLPPSHVDGVKNDGETGVDCGGAALPAKCAVGDGCGADADCNNVLCGTVAPTTCQPPSSTDGLQNGTETDVDCGGGAPTNAGKCTFDKKCLVVADCKTNLCSAAKKCTIPSCNTAETAGINSCGTGETGAPGASHDSCCKSLVLPTRTTKRLDKYEITSGRFRAFLASAGPNVSSFVTTYIGAHGASQLASLVALDTQLTTPANGNYASIYPSADRFVPMSLTAHMSHDIDNYDGIRGCYNGYTPCATDAQCGGAVGSCANAGGGLKACVNSGDFSANTYWMDNTHEADFGIPPRPTPRTISDEKSLNCAMPIMLAAFCAWDGDGELATLADYHDAWTTTYPWGGADTLRPTYNWCGGTYGNGGFLCQCDGVHNVGALCPAGGFSLNGEAGVFYEFPLGTDRSLDNEPLIAAPGRFPGDATSIKSGGESWMDLFANLAEYTGDFSASANDFCDFSAAPTVGAAGQCTRADRAAGDKGTHYTNIPKSGIIGDTWEGHQYGYGSANGFAVTFQYGKFGGRCVRPAASY